MLGLSVGVVHSMGWDKCIITHIHYYSITESVFVTLKIFCVPPSHPFKGNIYYFLPALLKHGKKQWYGDPIF